MNACCLQWKGLLEEFKEIKDKEIARLTKGKTGIPKSYFYSTAVTIASVNFCPTCGQKLASDIYTPSGNVNAPKEDASGPRKTRKPVPCPRCKHGRVGGTSCEPIKCMTCAGTGVINYDTHIVSALPSTSEEAADYTQAEQAEGGMTEIGNITFKDDEP